MVIPTLVHPFWTGEGGWVVYHQTCFRVMNMNQVNEGLPSMRIICWYSTVLVVAFYLSHLRTIVWLACFVSHTWLYRSCSLGLEWDEWDLWSVAKLCELFPPHESFESFVAPFYLDNFQTSWPMSHRDSLWEKVSGSPRIWRKHRNSEDRREDIVDAGYHWIPLDFPFFLSIGCDMYDIYWYDDHHDHHDDSHLGLAPPTVAGGCKTSDSWPLYDPSMGYPQTLWRLSQ